MRRENLESGEKSGFTVAEVLWPLVWQSDSFSFLVIKFRQTSDILLS
jgi:hypothetical protein